MPLFLPLLPTAVLAAALGGGGAVVDTRSQAGHMVSVVAGRCPLSELLDALRALNS